MESITVLSELITVRVESPTVLPESLTVRLESLTVLPESLTIRLESLTVGNGVTLVGYTTVSLSATVHDS